MTPHEAYAINLPKWPRMDVTGVQLTPQQVGEIYLRTDQVFTGLLNEYGHGNNHVWRQWYRYACGAGQFDHLFEGEAPILTYRDRWAINDKLNGMFNQLSQNYVHNTWGESCYVGGPYGWLHPSGRISYGHNIGKYPSVHEVVDDWLVLVTAFPYLDVTVTLWSGEYGERDDGEEQSVPLVTFSVNTKDGVPTVTFHDDHEAHHHELVAPLSIDNVLSGLHARLRQNYHIVEFTQDQITLPVTAEEHLRQGQMCDMLRSGEQGLPTPMYCAVANAIRPHVDALYKEVMEAVNSGKLDEWREMLEQKTLPHLQIELSA